MSVHRVLLIGLLLTALTPGVARADFLLTPFFGVNFGGDSGEELSDAVDASKYNWGVSLAWMGAGVFGFEGDIGYSNDFFGKTDAGGSSVLTMSGNLLLGIPFGGQQGFGVRPYGVVGVGVVRPDGDAFPESEVRRRGEGVLRARRYPRGRTLLPHVRSGGPLRLRRQ
jgi:hypothetical protein